MDTERERIDFDILFVGGGPASLAGAIRVMQGAAEKGLEPEVAVIEKGAEIGSHALSGAILNPRALQELMPDYREKGCPIETTVRGDGFYFLTANKSFKMPMTPRHMHNAGFHVVSLSKLTRWLAGIAEEMGVNIFPGFTGKEVLYGPDGKTVAGVRTGDQGIGKEGEKKPNFEPGIDLMAKVTIFGEGARGSLTADAAKKLGLFDGKLPQVFETGVKEVIQLPEDNGFTGGPVNDLHTLGYPLDLSTPGGGFIYEMADNRVSVGFLVGLAYRNAKLDLYDEFIKFKAHPFVADIIRGGTVVEQGARTVSTGGYYTMPELSVNGAMFVGGCAGMQNTPGLKGIHLAMKSGMLAAEAALAALEAGRFDKETLSVYPDSLSDSWAVDELYEGRNFAAALGRKSPGKWFHLGTQYITKGRGILDPMPMEPDARTLKPAKTGDPGRPDKELYDGTLYVDKLTGVYLSKTQHREDQPSHLIVHDTHLCVTKCWETYGSPCTRFCPGQVYEMETDETTGERKLKLNPSNCLHCKTCDIKDPYDNITWTCPEGGDGPNYTVV